ncbi:hypothetical protein AMST5_02484 [freshwater sediment metagenome]|uniref:Uncharacterized protein n=1 Tax=freshwater sediment metagenome TaxID=556182 RepID=A0AA48M048_9ZZZZ
MEANFLNGSSGNDQKLVSDLNVIEIPERAGGESQQAPQPTQDAPRRRLISAQKKRDEFLERFERAQSALELSMEVVKSLETRLTTYADICAQAAEECVASILKCIDCVERPKVEFSPETMNVWERMIDIEKKIAAARKAGEILESELKDSAKALEDAEDNVKNAAVAVAALTVEPIAEELAALESRAADLRRILLGYGALRHAGKFLPLSQKAANLLRAQKAAHDPQMMEKWMNYLNELSRNADATFSTANK